jgi:glycosyltransferase involved in cell wall biosynthesis
LQGKVDAILLIDPRKELRAVTFGVPEIAAYRRAHPRVRVVHRVNECDQRKGSDFMDRALKEAGEVVDFTVFISEWLRDYHIERWFDRARPHSVIYNGADPAIFHPFGTQAPTAGEPVRLVTHHWSNNRLKGFDVYEEIDTLLADGKLPGFEFHVIGKWPDDLRWRAAKTTPAAHGHELAKMLRKCHLYVTASRWEPCGMHHVEGAQCGLPLVYHEDGGGIVEAGRKYGVGFRDNVGAALAEARERLPELRQRVLESPPSGARMADEFARLITRLIASAV